MDTNQNIFISSDPYQDIFQDTGKASAPVDYMVVVYMFVSLFICMISLYIFWKNRHYLLAVFGLYDPRRVHIHEGLSQSGEDDEQDALLDEKDEGVVGKRTSILQAKSREQQEDAEVSSKTYSEGEVVKEDKIDSGKSAIFPKIEVDYSKDEPTLKIVS